MTPSYELVITNHAERDVRALDWAIADAVNAKIAELAANPRPHGCKKLVGSPAWRIRVRDYRILYYVDDRERRVTVAAVKHRSEAYD